MEMPEVIHPARMYADDHETAPPPACSHRPCHVLGRLAWRGRCIPRPCRRRSDQPGCADCTCRLSRDGALHLVRHRSAGPRFAGDGARLVTGHGVGPVPTLLGPLQAPDKRVCNHCPSDVHAIDRLFRDDGENGAIVRYKPDRAEESDPRDSRRRRAAAVARRHDAGGVQAAGDDPLWVAQAA